MSRSSKLTGGVLAIVSLAALIGVWAQRSSSAPSLVRSIAWHDSGVWLAADLHTHTRFSDGGHTPQELAAKAVEYGCDVLAITDHTDRGLNAATPKYHAAIADVRARTPNLVVLTGLEWNVPPGKGEDHATVLLPAGLDSAERTEEFKLRFDDLDNTGENPELTTAAFEWLDDHSSTEGSDAPLVFLNHPGRRAAGVEQVQQQLEWLPRIGGRSFVGVEGAPGHQKATALGAYSRQVQLEDRWDPTVVSVGAAWDQQLAAGVSLWGALASSDFHSEANGDYWPCQFSKTWVYAPDRSAAGVLRALRAGSFAGVHGGVANRIELRLMAAGLPRPALSGETVRLPKGTTATIELRTHIPSSDWAGQPNRIDVVQFIGVTREGASVIHSAAPSAEGTVHHEVAVPPEGVVIRARGRRVVDGPDLLFYTNPIFIRTGRGS